MTHRHCLWLRLSEKHLRLKMIKPRFVIPYSGKSKNLEILQWIYSLGRWILITGSSKFGLVVTTAVGDQAPLRPLISLMTNKQVAKKMDQYFMLIVFNAAMMYFSTDIYMFSLLNGIFVCTQLNWWKTSNASWAWTSWTVLGSRQIRL